MQYRPSRRLRYLGFSAARLVAWVLPVTLAAQDIGPQSIYGTAVDEHNSPMAGVKVKLKSGSDSAVTGADGRYSLNLPIRMNAIFPFTPGAAEIRAGKVYLETGPGRGRGRGGEAINALGRKVFPSRVPRGQRSAPAAKRSGTPRVLDTVVAEKSGFYSVMEIIGEYPLANLPMMPFIMFPNSLHGMDPGEITAWKEFLSKPAVTLRLTRTGIEFPREATEGAIVKADGDVVSGWSADACNPGDLPRSVRLNYVKDGLAFRDSIPLAPFWNLLQSFRTTIDSVAPNRRRYAMSWEWPESLSVRPERDWMAVKLGDMSVDEYISYPDVNQVGVRRDFEGGATRYGQFQPGADSFTVVTWDRPGPRMKARFTWKSHAGHDLRIDLDDYYMPDPAKDFAFITPWPGEGLRARSSLRLAQESNPPVREATLEFSIPGHGDAWTIDPRWDGRELDWKFPFPTRGGFQLKVRATENASVRCRAVAESPLLQILPDPSDTAVTAFEPNDDEGQAASVPKGVLLGAAWDFRPQPEAQSDEDMYRFRAAAGEKIRIRVVNPNAREIIVAPLCDDQWPLLAIAPMAEGALTFTATQAGDCLFSVDMDEPTTGRYQFRVDTVD